MQKDSIPLEFTSSNKKKKFFITFYCLKRKSSEVKIQKKEIEKVVWLPAEEAMALIKTGRTKFPKDFDYENIFQKIRDIVNNEKENNEVSK